MTWHFTQFPTKKAKPPSKGNLALCVKTVCISPTLPPDGRCLALNYQNKISFFPQSEILFSSLVTEPNIYCQILINLHNTLFKGQPAGLNSILIFLLHNVYNLSIYSEENININLDKTITKRVRLSRIGNLSVVRLWKNAAQHVIAIII